MHRRLLLLLLLPVIGVAQAVQAPADDAASAQPTGSVEGRVANAQTGDGIPGADIRLIPLHAPTGAASVQRNATSQPDGTFTVDAVPPGTYLIIATQSNFTAGANGAQSRPTINIDPGQQVTNVSIQLTPIGRIHGKVIDDEANPVQGARVEAFTIYSARGKNQLRRVSQADTDEQGRFSLKTDVLGRYYLAAQLEKEPPPAKSDDPKDTPEQPALDLVRTFYPKALDIENATPIDLSSGQDTPEVTIQLVRAAAHHIRGKIEGLEAGGRRPTVTLGPRGSLASDGIGTVVTLEKDGTFDIPKVVSGAYTLTATGTVPAENSGIGQSRTISRPRLLAKQDVDVGADDVNGIVLTVIPLATLSGRVTVDGVDNTDLSRVRINLIPAGATAIGGFQNVSVQRDGSFEIDNLAPGQYMVRVLGDPSGTYVRSVTYNRQDITTTGIDLTQGGGGEIDVVLRNGTGEIDGTLQSDAPISATTVMVLAPDALAMDGSGVLLANMQSTGSFVARNVPPGRYYAYAVERWSPLWQNPDFLRSIRNQGTTVDLPENGHLQVQLSIISSDQIEAVAVPLGLTSQ